MASLILSCYNKNMFIEAYISVVLYQPDSITEQQVNSC